MAASPSPGYLSDPGCQQRIVSPFPSADLIQKCVELRLPIQCLIYFGDGGIGISAKITRGFDGAAKNVITQLWIIPRTWIPFAIAPDRVDPLWGSFGKITHVVFDITIKICRKKQPRVV